MEETAQKIVSKMLTGIEKANDSTRGLRVRELQTFVSTLQEVRNYGGWDNLCSAPTLKDAPAGIPEPFSPDNPDTGTFTPEPVTVS